MDDVARAGREPDCRVVVVDDSTHETHRRCNERIVSICAQDWLVYHGPEEQRRLLDDVGHLPGLSRFIRPLGHPTWDLGAVRNYMGLLATMLGGTSAIVFMIDDDVVVLPPPGPCGSSLCLLEKAVASSPGTIAGGRLLGAPDVSRVEAVLRRCGDTPLFDLALRPHRLPISGGFLAYDSVWARRVCFPRTYNEDWIWLLHCASRGASLATTDATGDHRSVTKDRVDDDELARELLGEILFEGWYRVATRRDPGTEDHEQALTQPSLWEALLREEQSRIARLDAAAGDAMANGHRSAAVEPARAAVARERSNLARLDAGQLARFSRDYFANLRAWQVLTRALLQRRRLARAGCGRMLANLPTSR